MEDEDEIQSPTLLASGSPESQHQNGRVTVAAAPPSPHPKPLTLALSIRQQTKVSGNGRGGGCGREDCWSEGASAILIDAWGERFMELHKGNLKQKDWKEVADIVNSREDYTKAPKTDVQCKNRIDTVKKKYKLEKAKIATGGGHSKWPFFQRLDRLIGPSPNAKLVHQGGMPSGSQKVPMGIPVGVKPIHPFQQKNQQKQQFGRKAPVDSDSSGSKLEPSPDDLSDSPPRGAFEKKRPRIQMELNSGFKATRGEYEAIWKK